MRWVLERWYIPLLAIAALVGIVLFRGRGGITFATLKRELAAIKEAAKVRQLLAKLGTEKARAEVERQHAEAIETLDADQKLEAARLREDPARLAKFLVRAAG